MRADDNMDDNSWEKVIMHYFMNQMILPLNFQ
jgi:hypothetical protein